MLQAGTHSQTWAFRASHFVRAQRDEWIHLPGCEFEPVPRVSRDEQDFDSGPFSGSARSLSRVSCISFPCAFVCNCTLHIHTHAGDGCTTGSTATGDIFIFIQDCRSSSSRACYSIHNSAPYSARKERASGERDEIDILTDGNPDDEGAGLGGADGDDAGS